MLTEVFVVGFVERRRYVVGQVDEFVEQAQEAFRLVKSRGLYVGIQV